MKKFPVHVDLLLKSDVFQKKSNWEMSKKNKYVAITGLQSALRGWRQPCCTTLRKEERKQERLTMSPKPSLLLGQTRLWDTGLFFSSKVHEKVVKSPLTASRNKHKLEKHPTAPVSLPSYQTHKKPLYNVLTPRIPAASTATHAGNKKNYWWR